MPPTVIDLRRADDTRDVIHRAVQALAEGWCVGFPTENDYVVAGCLRHPEAVARLLGWVRPTTAAPRLALVLRGADEALDWAPGIGHVGQRLLRRCWPGPVAAVVPCDHPDSLVHHIPAPARDAVGGGSTLRLRCPGHPLLAECMRMLAGPVGLAATAPDEQLPVQAADLLAVGAPGMALLLDDGPTRYAQPPTTVAIEADGIRVVRGGIVAEETIHRLASLMVLFVCTGNTCRSPMAEALFRSMLSERLACRPDEVESRGVVVASAGLSAWGGGKASPGALEAMAEVGADLSAHESQPVTENLVRQADVILTMTAAHRAAILAQFPDAAGRVSMLSPDRQDVLDPIGGPLATYRRCAEQIRGHLAARIDTLAAALPRPSSGAGRGAGGT
jgi:protein-tyrosine-phosphatase/tRNA A37 threonylcarbamoyladenosine synthetase subunit TsaC/SUA5/YrdC